MDRIPVGTLCIILPTRDGSGQKYWGCAFNVTGHLYAGIGSPLVSREDWDRHNYHALNIDENTTVGAAREFLLPITPDDDIQSEKEEAPTMADWDKLRDRIAAI